MSTTTSTNNFLQYLSQQHVALRADEATESISGPASAFSEVVGLSTRQLIQLCSERPGCAFSALPGNDAMLVVAGDALDVLRDGALDRAYYNRKRS